MQKNRKKERKQNLTPSGASIVCNCLIFQQSDKHPLPFVDKGQRNMDIMTYFSIVLFFAPSPPHTQGKWKFPEPGVESKPQL